MNFKKSIPIIILCLGISIFWMGFHSVDNSVNIMRLTNCGEGYYEELLDGRIWTLKESYLNGLKMMVLGFSISIISGFLVGGLK